MSRTRVIFKRLGKLFKFAIACILVAVIAILIWRLFTTSIPSELSPLIPNEKLKAAYAQSGDDLYIFEQKYDTLTRGANNSGYFSIEQARFIPTANQAQIIFRYNNSTIEKVAADKKLAEVPSRDTELFDVSLVLYIDLTPENKNDNFLKNSEFSDSNVMYDMFVNPETTKAVRLTPNANKQAKSDLYNFYKYTFEFDSAELDLADLIKENKLVTAHADIYYNKEIDYEKDAYGTICIFDARAENLKVALTNEDKELLKN